jgi:tetratricopeptide (TPR) repeat protein
MNPIKHLHQTAMEYAVLADVAEAKGKSDDAKLYYRKAFEMENEVVQMMPTDDAEPFSRFILLRSAAALAYHAGQFEESERLIRLTLAQGPPAFIQKELKDISKLVKKAITAASNPKANTTHSVHAEKDEQEILAALKEIERANELIARQQFSANPDYNAVEKYKLKKQLLLQELAELLKRFEVEVRLNATA